MVLRYSNYNNRIIYIVSLLWGHSVRLPLYLCLYATLIRHGLKLFEVFWTVVLLAFTFGCRTTNDKMYVDTNGQDGVKRLNWLARRRLEDEMFLIY